MMQQKQIRLGTMRLWIQSLASFSELRIWHSVSCGGGCRRSSDLALLWFWCRPAATAPMRPLAWEPPYAVGAALEKGKKKKPKKTKQKKPTCIYYLCAQKRCF